MSESQSSRLGVVNGLRGVAILMVVYDHLGVPYFTPFGVGIRRVHGFAFSPWTLLTHGWLGVNLFFLLSGFVLALPYETGYRQMHGLRDAGSFLLRRARRLVPLLYFVTLISIYLRAREKWPSPWEWDEVLKIASFTFVFEERRFMPSFDFPLWSLGVEAWLSVLIPGLLLFAARFGMRALAVCAFAFALGVRYYATATRLSPPAPLDFIKDGPFGRLDDFVLGIVICRLYVTGRVPRGVWATVSLVLGLVAVTASGVLWDNVIFNSWNYRITSVLHDATSLGFGLVLLGFLGAPRAFTRPLTLPPLQLCGMMCYSIYVWHMFKITLRGPPWNVVQLPFALVLVFVLSAFSYRYVEFPHVPARKLFTEFPD